jgi:TonB family protein
MKIHLKAILIVLFILPVCLTMAQTKTVKKDTGRVIVTDKVFVQTQIDNSMENFDMFDAYLKKQIKHIPNTHGIVMVFFKTETDGSITNIKIDKSLNKAADAEAIRLMKGCPKWKPDAIDGKPISANTTIPITFK